MDTGVIEVHLYIPVTNLEDMKYENQKKGFLLIDGIVNLILGIILLLFPFGVDEVLGVPQPLSNFYPTILGSFIL